MVGLPSRPSTGEGLIFSLIDNGSIETMACGGWTVAWAVTGALLVVCGVVIHSSALSLRRQVVTVAAVLMAISVMGVIVHAIRAAMAVTSSQKLAVRKRPATSYDRVVAWLTTPTPWVLLPQSLLGIAVGVFGAVQTMYR